MGVLTQLSLGDSTQIEEEWLSGTVADSAAGGARRQSSFDTKSATVPNSQRLMTVVGGEERRPNGFRMIAWKVRFSNEGFSIG